MILYIAHASPCEIKGKIMRKKATFAILGLLIIIIGLLTYKYSEDIPFFSNLIMEYKIDSIKKKIKDEPYSVNLHYRLAQLYLKQGELNKYEEKLQILRKISPDSYLYAEELGDHLFKLKQYKSSIKAYNDALAFADSEDGLIHFKIGNAYANLKNKQKAIEEYQIQLNIFKKMNNHNKTKKVEEFIESLIKKLLENTDES